VPAPPPLPPNDWLLLHAALVVPLPSLLVGRVTEMRATGDYFGLYFTARRAPSRMYFANSHISLMHSRAHRALTADQIARVVRRAQAELTGLPVVTTNTMVLVWNDDGSLRRGYQDLQGMTLLAEKMWQLRNMVCNWLGPAYGERRRDFHISFDSMS
jgi:hypothetical protein